jgi:hypothetical protein
MYMPTPCYIGGMISPLETRHKGKQRETLRPENKTKK